ncbi:MAG: hypothetical protein QQW96_22175 [Tychonema bourrellyi B0820]|nr:hypothetical protein [Tychonema bourrellyi]MDQ2100344.1 hypothetical protein [Tychonema bourrellyi B0820]
MYNSSKPPKVLFCQKVDRTLDLKHLILPSAIPVNPHRFSESLL